jgi:hypothetical protein
MRDAIAAIFAIPLRFHQRTVQGPAPTFCTLSHANRQPLDGGYHSSYVGSRVLEIARHRQLTRVLIPHVKCHVATDLDPSTWRG